MTTVSVSGAPADIAGSVCIVTGGASGIGRAICRQLAARGAAVVIADVDVAGGKETRAGIETTGGRALFVPTDVSLGADVQRLLETTVSTYGRPSILVHAAAVMTFTRVAETPEEDWDRVFAVNVRSAFLLGKHALPLMRDGAIVYISSVHAHRTSGGVVPYAASKGALEALTRGLSVEAAERGVRVNCLAPGGVNTPMLWTNPHFVADQSLVDVASPDEIAAVVVFLASPAASCINGATLIVDNGLLVRL